MLEYLTPFAKQNKSKETTQSMSYLIDRSGRPGIGRERSQNMEEDKMEENVHITTLGEVYH